MSLQSKLTEIGMPACTKVDIDDPWVLGAFKLPQIHELALDFSHTDAFMIWQEHIAVNANLSGLNLLHMKYWPFGEDLIPILRSLPLLETLIITAWDGSHCFTAFLPMDADEASGLKQTSAEGNTLAVLCPRLQHLQIYSNPLYVLPDLVPTFKDIVNLRAERGSPLKVFTFFEFHYNPRRMLALIGRDGSFAMEKSVLAKAEKFQLDI